MTGLRKDGEVTWHSHGGTAHGTVEKKVTGATKVGNHTAKATKDDPQYVVRSDNGKKAAHKRAALKQA